jgi:hypothetical protein
MRPSKGLRRAVGWTVKYISVSLNLTVSACGLTYLGVMCNNAVEESRLMLLLFLRPE